MNFISDFPLGFNTGRSAGSYHILIAGECRIEEPLLELIIAAREHVL